MEGAGSLVLYILVFVGVLLTVDGLIQLAFGSGQEAKEEAVNKRLRLLSSGMDPEEVLRLLRRERRGTLLERIGVLRRWPALWGQAGLGGDPNRALLVVVAGVAALLLVLRLLGMAWWLAAALGLVVGVALPILVLVGIRNRRLAALDRQLPEGIDLMVRSLRSGHPLNASIQLIAREIPDPLGTEMGIVADAITYGDALTDAVTDFAQRVGVEDARYLAVAITIQGRTGGNLAAVLEALARVIRERFAMKRKIRAVSAEGRITAYLVSATPFIIYGALNLVAPSFYGDVKDDPLFDYFLMTGLGLAALNALILRKLVRFHF